VLAQITQVGPVMAALADAIRYYRPQVVQLAARRGTPRSCRL